MNCIRRSACSLRRSFALKNVQKCHANSIHLNGTPTSELWLTRLKKRPWFKTLKIFHTDVIRHPYGVVFDRESFGIYTDLNEFDAIMNIKYSVPKSF